jgi:hypothetical protein
MELLSTVQTQPHESADAKGSLGLEADSIRKAWQKARDALFCINYVIHNQ